MAKKKKLKKRKKAKKSKSAMSSKAQCRMMAQGDMKKYQKCMDKMMMKEKEMMM